MASIQNRMAMFYTVSYSHAMFDMHVYVHQHLHLEYCEIVHCITVKCRFNIHVMAAGQHNWFS